MIEQVLHRDFVLARLEEVSDFLSGEAERRGPATQAPEAEDLSSGDYDETLSHVRLALGAERSSTTGQKGFEAPPSERRGETPAPLDDFSYFSRDMVVSNLQYALEAYFTEGPDTRRDDERAGEAAPAGRRGGEPAVTAGLRLPIGETRDLDNRRVFEQFSITDIGWVSSLLAMGVRRFRRRHDFSSTPPAPRRIARDARLLLIADWGTGIPRAAKVADHMREVLAQGLTSGREQHVLHLGDVYYAGWQKEYERRFLPFWPVDPARAGEIGSYCLNGNHDMYAGGFGYFDYLLAEPRFKPYHQGCSYFRLFNDDWNIMALDTAWDDNGLKNPQQDWVQQNLNAAGRSMLLSHHQPFSAYKGESDGSSIRKKLQSTLDTGAVTAWFWGHEHRHVNYDSAMGVKYGRLIGHGGVPVYRSGDPDGGNSALARFVYRDSIDSGLEHWAKMGFAVLDFNGPSVAVRYINEDGAEYFSESLG